MLATAWHIYTGGRSAECFRARWDDFKVPGLDETPYVWALGLSGVLQAFQDMPGTGFTMVSELSNWRHGIELHGHGYPGTSLTSTVLAVGIGRGCKWGRCVAHGGTVH
jgi:hypothetical protein